METDAFRPEKEVNKAKSHDIGASEVEREVTLLQKFLGVYSITYKIIGEAWLLRLSVQALEFG